MKYDKDGKPEFSDQEIKDAEGRIDGLIRESNEGPFCSKCKKHIYKLNEIKQNAAADIPKPVSLQEALSQVKNFSGPNQSARKNKPKEPPADLEGLRSLLSDIKPNPQ